MLIVPAYIRGLTNRTLCHGYQEVLIRCQSTIRCVLSDVATPVQESQTVHGWVRSLRRGKHVGFLTLNDGSTHESLQAVLTPGQASDPSFGASVRVSGQLVKSIKSNQQYELKADSVQLLGEAPASFPLQKKYASAEHLREQAHFRPRTQFTSSLLRIQSSLLHCLSSFFLEQQFVQVLPPVLTSSDCEGAGETFEISKSEGFFGRKANLIVSSQLHLEALAAGLGRVWTVTPTFRAERSTTARHLAEFRMIEAELCFTHTLDQVMDVVESMIRSLTESITQSREMEFMRQLDAENIEKGLRIQERWNSILGRPWVRIKYIDAIQLLQAATPDEPFKFVPSQGAALQAEHEKWLAAHFGGPVFVTNYPANQKPFYMLPSLCDDTVECFDLLVPSMGELCGGSLREHNLESLLAKMQDSGLNATEMEWYTDLRKYGSVPHGGFGVGWERMVGYLCGISNVREIAAFPRWVNHCVG